MHLKGIKKLLNIPEYTITGVSLSLRRVDIYLKALQKKQTNMFTLQRGSYRRISQQPMDRS